MSADRTRIHADTARPRPLRPTDEDYPAPLRAIPAPPDLHVRGGLLAADALAVAIVGSRHASSYGIAVAAGLAADLAARGVTVVSGLARGIDTAAHEGALGGGGRTLAVLGSGVDVIYPPENVGLAARIVERGALLSPFAPGSRPHPRHFPARNRLIAGLSLAVVVVEAAEKSGALITAGFAGDLGREVMAVPGRVTSGMSRGTHRLLRDGATLVETWKDVVEGLPEPWRRCLVAVSDGPVTGQQAEGGAGDEGRLLAALGEAPETIERLIERSGLDSARAMVVLTTLEVDGRVRQHAGKRFSRAIGTGRG